MLLSLCAASVVAAILKCRKKRRKNRKTWTREWLKNRTLLAELGNHVFRSHVVLSTHINTFSRFHSNTAAVSVAMLDLSTSRETPNSKTIGGRRSTSGNLLKGIDSSSILFNNVQLPFNMLKAMFQHSTIHDTLFNIRLGTFVAQQMLNRVSLALDILLESLMKSV